MDRRGLLETGATTLACGTATAGLLRVGTGGIDWWLVVGVALGAAFAAAANYRARIRHSSHVADASPAITEDVGRDPAGGADALGAAGGADALEPTDGGPERDAAGERRAEEPVNVGDGPE